MKKKSTLSRVIKYVGRYPFATIGSLLLSAVTVLFSLLVPVLIGEAVDCITEQGIVWKELFKNMIWIAA